MSLAALLVTVVIVAVAWALLVPPWQTPDEVAHFAYAQTLAENFRLPGDKARPEDSTEQDGADVTVGASRGAFFPAESPPEWDPNVWAAYRREVQHSAPTRTDGGGPNPAALNPPLFYLYADVAYLLDDGGTVFGRLYAMRIWGVLLVVLTCVGAWLLAGEILGRRRLPQTACAGVAGLLPMETFMGTGVNPDALLVPLWTFVLWLGARVIIRRAPGREAVALCAVTAAAILTKATSYALLPAVALALVAGWRARPPAERRARLKPLAAASLALIIPVLGWVLAARAAGRSAVNTITPSAHATPFIVRQFLSYVWQFYLPRLPSLTPLAVTRNLAVYEIWLKQATGAFGWLSVALPGWIYSVAAVLAGAVTLATAALLTRVRGRASVWLLAFLALTVAGLLAGLHLTEYRSLIAKLGPILQGRYLLPLVGLLGLAFGFLISHLPARLRPGACSALLVALLALQVISLGSVLRAFYL